MKTRSGNWYIISSPHGDYNKSAFDSYNLKKNVYKVEELLLAFQNEYIYRR